MAFFEVLLIKSAWEEQIVFLGYTWQVIHGSLSCYAGIHIWVYRVYMGIQGILWYIQSIIIT